MSQETTVGFLDRARGAAAAGLIAAGATGILGSLLDWVTITAPPTEQGRAEATRPFNGVEATDGWWVIGLSAVLILMAIMLTVRRRSLYAWLGFLVSIVIGGIAIADYRGIGEISSSISQRMDIVGDADPAIGITLVAASALIGVIASLVGVAATPRAPADPGTV